MDKTEIKFEIVQYLNFSEKINLHYSSKENFKYLYKNIIAYQIYTYFSLLKLMKRRPIIPRLYGTDGIELFDPKCNKKKINSEIQKYKINNNLFKILQATQIHSYYLSNSIIALDTFSSSTKDIINNLNDPCLNK